MIFKLNCSSEVQSADVKQFFDELFNTMGVRGEFLVEHSYQTAPSYNGRREGLRSEFTVKFLNEKDQFIVDLKCADWTKEEVEDTYYTWFAYEFARRVSKYEREHGTGRK